MSRTALALRLALAARDQLAAEVESLREEVAALAQRADWAEHHAEQLQDALEQASGDRADIALCLTQEGRVVVAARQGAPS